MATRFPASSRTSQDAKKMLRPPPFFTAVVSVPPALQVGAAYGVTVRQGAPASAQAFAQMLLAPWAQAIFARYGFDQP